MKFTFTVGMAEKTTVEFTRGGFWGKIRIRANGQEVYANSIANPATHFSLTLDRGCELTVGEKEIQKIQIRKTRPLFLAGFRPHTYQVFCDGRLIAQHIGY